MSRIRHAPTAPTALRLHAGGDVIDRHRHDEHQLVYTSRGVVAVTTPGGSWVIGNDRAIWLPAGIWHDHRFYGTTSFHTLGFRDEHAPPPGPLPDDAPTVVAVDALMRELLVACSDPATSARDAEHMRVVIGDRLHRTTLAPVWLPAPSDQRLAAACRIVEQHLSETIGIDDLAHAVHVAPRTLSRLFRTDLAMTYPRWRTNQRVLRAMVCLAEGHDVTSTAQLCGWATPSAFVDTFGRVTGHTPGNYRALVIPA